MSDVEVKRWKNEFLEVDLWSIRVGRKFYFFCKELASALEYKDPKKAIQKHLDPEDKITMEEILGREYRTILEQSFSNRGILPPFEFFQMVRSRQNLTSEIGVYILCTKSRMEKVKPFQKWIYKTIETIRETGSYTLPSGPVDNPLDLVAKIENHEKEIEGLKKVKTTCNKKTQTQEISRLPIKKLKNRLKRSAEKVKKVELELEKSIREITTSSSSSSISSYSSSSRRSSSSDD